MSEIFNKRDNDNDISGASNQRTCPLLRYDCRDRQFNESLLQEHYISEQHQKSAVKCVQQMIDDTNGDSSKADSDMEEGKDVLFEAYEQLSITAKNIETNHDKLAQLDDELFSCKNQISTLPEQLNDLQTNLSLQKTHIDAIELNQNVFKQDVLSLKQEIENAGEIINQEPDGTMVWRITNVQEKMYDAQSERQTSVYSPSFYTSNCGYNVCARLYLNGDGSARGSHISIFLVIRRGLYDGLLTWPFSFRVSFCLYDQRTMMEKNGIIQPNHVIESFRPDTNSISFEKPRSAMNIASGIPKFFSLNDFTQPTNQNLYIVNDTIYIKTFIDFIGMPRSILPFVFNLNIGFPAHIRQKLILEELKRREEQTTN